MGRIALFAIVTWTVLLLPVSAAAQLEKGTDKKVCQAELEKNYLTKRLVAVVGFPASADGIDLSLDGKWDQKETSRRTKKSGGGIDIDDAATVTQVKLKDNLLEIQLNGGGFGTFGDFLSSSEKQRQERSVQGKASGGSRINLRFNRSIDCATLADPSAMIGFLAPLVRTDALKQMAALKAIPQEWAEAAAQRRVVVGMEKTTVFAIFGEPKQKQVDMASTPPTEKWQYDLPDLKTRIITFQDGKVTKVEEF